jgi:hypothetical protein
LIEELKEKEDMFQAIALLQRCYEEMKYDQNGHSFDIKSVFNSLISCMETGIVLIAKELGKVKGIACVFFFPSFMDTNNVQAIEAVWHSDPYLKKIKRGKIMIALQKEMEKKTKEKGFNGIVLTTSVDYPSVEGYLKKKGYSLKEKSYYKEI